MHLLLYASSRLCVGISEKGSVDSVGLQLAFGVVYCFQVLISI